MDVPAKPTSARPELSPRERREVEQRSAPRAVVVYEAIEIEGESELRRTWSALAWSGLGAGLSMGFSLVTQGILMEYLPNATWTPLIARFGYTIGFLIVILGRQQLFTENTLTPILPLLSHPDLKTLWRVSRLWVIVLLTNLIGALIFAWIVGNTTVFSESIKQHFTTIGHEAMNGDFFTTLLRAVFAGWLIAMMVWLLPAADSARIWVIIIITYVVGLGGFSHIIAGSVEVLYLVTTGSASWAAFFGSFFLPTLLGNILGGVSLVAVLNHAQVTSGGGEE